MRNSENDPRNKVVDQSKNIEALLYSQEHLLTNALNQLQQNDTQTTDMYFLTVAGYGNQDVFLKETQFISWLLNNYFNANQQTIALINHFDTVATHPLATKTSIARAVKAMEQVMDTDNDILFILKTAVSPTKACI